MFVRVQVLREAVELDKLVQHVHVIFDSGQREGSAASVVHICVRLVLRGRGDVYQRQTEYHFRKPNVD